jgi:dolichol-phosphate mannosyltransferase
MKKFKNNAVVIIPIYNNLNLIYKLVDSLFKEVSNKINKYMIKLLIIDTTSTDGISLLKQKIKKYTDIHLIVEKQEKSIGAAYIKGLKYAVEKLKADVIIEYDGDFQYPPGAIIDLLNEIDNGFDYVLASRKIKGGGYPKNWGFKRNLFSRFGSFVVRFLLFFPFKYFFKITDPTTGLKATRIKYFFEKLDLDNLIDKGFGYKIELLYRMTQLDAKIKEIPLKFQISEEDESKIENDASKNIFKTILSLRYKDKNTRRFIKFGIVGFSGYLVNGFFTELFFRLSFIQSIADYFHGFEDVFGLKLLTSKSAWASGLGIEISIISNYIFNNLWTFSSHKINKLGKFILKLLQFNFTSIGAIILEFSCVGLITLLFGDTVLIRQIAIILSIGFLIIPYNWFMYNKIIWKKKNIEK